MEVGSPENGFDEISDFLKDDESTLPDDLDLSFIINKDIAAGYACDDLASNDKFNFHFSEQGESELPSLSSNLGYYDFPGPCTENLHSSTQTRCHHDDLLDTDIVYDQKLHFESQGNQYHEDTEKLSGGYLGNPTFQVKPGSMDQGVLKNICAHQQGFISMQDHTLEGEMMDRPNSPPHIETGEKTLLEELQQELNRSDFACKEDEVSVQQIEKLHFSPRSHWGDQESKSENVNEFISSPDASKEVESPRVDQPEQERIPSFSESPVTTKEIAVVSPETSHCAHQLTDDQGYSASQSLEDVSYSNTTFDQVHHQDECFDQNGDTPSLDQSLHAGRQNSASSHGSWRRSQQMEGSPEKCFATPARDHLRLKRSRSQSPGRRRKSSSRCKGSSETAACSHRSPRSQNIYVSQEGRKELSHSSGSRKHKHDLAGSSDRNGEITCKDHVRHSTRKNSSIPRESRPSILDSSFSKHAPASPRNHYSHQYHSKVGRSVSPSPHQRRDLYSGYKGEHNRSQSRSPRRRDYLKSPRIRYSLRHRSPPRGYTSRHRSPEIRYLSPASYRRTRIGKRGSCLFVAGFGFLTTERELERKFSQFGRVRDVRIIRDKRSGISRGYGFLSLARDEEADAAIRALHKTEWNGRVVLVEKSISN